MEIFWRDLVICNEKTLGTMNDYFRHALQTSGAQSSGHKLFLKFLELIYFSETNNISLPEMKTPLNTSENSGHLQGARLNRRSPSFSAKSVVQVKKKVRVEKKEALILFCFDFFF